MLVGDWEHLVRDRGVLDLLILDDPQELLDEENRERLAAGLLDLRVAGAQIFVTTYDRRFAASVADLGRKGVTVDHRSVHPATAYQPTLQVPVSVAMLTVCEERLRSCPDDVHAVQEYASECRVFVETRLGELFDNAAHPAWSTWLLLGSGVVRSTVMRASPR
jgi:ABC-type sulfate/molybdate transport systems ATPase subunit